LFGRLSCQPDLTSAVSRSWRRTSAESCPAGSDHPPACRSETRGRTPRAGNRAATVLWWRKTAAAALRTESVAVTAAKHLQRLRPVWPRGDPIQHEQRPARRRMSARSASAPTARRRRASTDLITEDCRWDARTEGRNAPPAMTHGRLSIAGAGVADAHRQAGRRVEIDSGPRPPEPRAVAQVRPLMPAAAPTSAATSCRIRVGAAASTKHRRGRRERAGGSCSARDRVGPPPGHCPPAPAPPGPDRPAPAVAGGIGRAAPRGHREPAPAPSGVQRHRPLAGTFQQIIAPWDQLRRAADAALGPAVLSLPSGRRGTNRPLPSRTPRRALREPGRRCTPGSPGQRCPLISRSKKTG